MTEITDKSQIDTMRQSYEENVQNATAWNKLDADGHWDKNDVEKFAKGFDNTPEGQKALETIIDLIEQGKLDQNNIAVIKDKGVDSQEFITSIFDDQASGFGETGTPSGAQPVTDINDPLILGMLGQPLPASDMSTPITNSAINDTQKKLINEAYAKNAAAWNALDADGWSVPEIAEFAAKFDDTEKGTKELKAIINLIKEGKLNTEVIEMIKDKGIKEIDSTNGTIEFNVPANNGTGTPASGGDSTIIEGVMSGLAQASGGTGELKLTPEQQSALDRGEMVSFGDGSSGGSVQVLSRS
jgi:DNA-binding ferritin-like protein (Dps family)